MGDAEVSAGNIIIVITIIIIIIGPHHAAAWVVGGVAHLIQVILRLGVHHAGPEVHAPHGGRRRERGGLSKATTGRRTSAPRPDPVKGRLTDSRHPTNSGRSRRVGNTGAAHLTQLFHKVGGAPQWSSASADRGVTDNRQPMKRGCLGCEKRA
jgi:hypothetical protein